MARISEPRLGLSREPVASFGLAGLDVDPASALQDWLMKKRVRPWPLQAAGRAGRPHGSGAGSATRLHSLRHRDRRVRQGRAGARQGVPRADRHRWVRDTIRGRNALHFRAPASPCRSAHESAGRHATDCGCSQWPSHVHPASAPRPLTHHATF